MLRWLTFISTTGMGWAALLSAHGNYEKSIIYAIAVAFSWVMSDEVQINPVDVDVNINK